MGISPRDRQQPQGVGWGSVLQTDNSPRGWVGGGGGGGESWMIFNSNHLTIVVVHLIFNYQADIICSFRNGINWLKPGLQHSYP